MQARADESQKLGGTWWNLHFTSKSINQARISEVGVSTKGLKLETTLEIRKVSPSGGFGDGAEGGDGVEGVAGATGVTGAAGDGSRGAEMLIEAETGTVAG